MGDKMCCRKPPKIERAREREMTFFLFFRFGDGKVATETS